MAITGAFQASAFQGNGAYQTTLGALLSAASDWLIRYRRLARR